MQTINYIRVFVIISLFTVFLSLTSATTAAQTATSYRFLEVIDADGKPVADATVETFNHSRIDSISKTDQNGRLEKGFPVSRGDRNTTGFRVSKSGYFVYEDIGLISGHFSDHKERIKLELLVIPKTDAEREAIGDEQIKREFFLAAKNGDSAAVKKLLQAGLSANLTTTDLRGVPISQGVPVIAFATSSGNDETVKILLAAGAKIPIDEKDQAALMFVAAQSTAGTVKMLLDKGISVKAINAIDERGYTVLMTAVLFRRGEIVNLLLKSGADPNILSPLTSAANPGVFLPNNCATALINAVVHREDIGILQSLIASGADVNLSCQRHDKTALTEAVKHANVAAVKMLIEAGADFKGEQARAALSFAIERSSAEWDYRKSDFQKIIKLLEAAGAPR